MRHGGGLTPGQNECVDVCEISRSANFADPQPEASERASVRGECTLEREDADANGTIVGHLEASRHCWSYVIAAREPNFTNRVRRSAD
jgi:hypothetical protein